MEREWLPWRVNTTETMHLIIFVEVNRMYKI